MKGRISPAAGRNGPGSSFVTAPIDRRQRPPGQPPGAHVLRLSVTDRCNFRCRYCMPAEGIPKIRHDDLLSLERLAGCVGWLAGRVGITSIKLTGGEPLARPGLETLVRLVAAVPGVEEISMTTNGSLLARHAGTLRRAGLRRVNISLDTLDSRRFASVTRGARLADTVQGIDAAVTAGLTPVKLNAVLLASSWRQDVPRLLDFASEQGLEIRFIELMRTGTEAAWTERELVTAATVRAWLAEQVTVEPVVGPAAAPARLTRVAWAGRPVTVGWITPQSHPFCAACNRLRLDARGMLRRCLMDPTPLDLGRLLEEPAPETKLDAYLAGKRPPAEMSSLLPMATVGG